MEPSLHLFPHNGIIDGITFRVEEPTPLPTKTVARDPVQKLAVFLADRGVSLLLISDVIPGRGGTVGR